MATIEIDPNIPNPNCIANALMRFNARNNSEIQRDSPFAARLDPYQMQIQLQARYGNAWSRGPSTGQAQNAIKMIYQPPARAPPVEVPTTTYIYNNSISTLNPSSLRAKPVFDEAQKMGHR